jgi:hypothetical protein
MKTNKIEIVYFDTFFRANMNNRHDFLTNDYRNKIRAAIYADNDFDLIEMYEIMLMPLVEIQPVDNQKQPLIWLKYFCLSCVGKSLYLNIFTGNNWQYFIVKL